MHLPDITTPQKSNTWVDEEEEPSTPESESAIPQKSSTQALLPSYNPENIRRRPLRKTSIFEEPTEEQNRKFFTQKLIEIVQFTWKLPPPDIELLISKRRVLPRQKRFRGCKTLIFDLDETLVHCQNDSQSDADAIVAIQVPNGEPVQTYVKFRPFVQECLKEANRYFEVMVFTASNQAYADPIIDAIDPEQKLIHHRLYRDDCIQIGNQFIKDLRIIADRKLEDMIVIDNSAYSFAYQVDNGIPIMSFYDNEGDQELLDLMPYFRIFSEVKDIRTVNRKLFSINAVYENHVRNQLKSFKYQCTISKMDEEIPVFNIQGLPKMIQPDYSRLAQKYKQLPAGTPLVIDNGSFNCRAGWACEELPCLDFRNIVARQKTSDSSSALTGPEIPESELYKFNIRSPYERNIVQHYHTQEHIFDYIFSSLGIDNEVSHPLLITEPICVPNYCKEMMLELMFECYKVPRVNFGIDCVFSFFHNRGSASGMILSIGHTACHVLPVYRGAIQLHNARRMNMGTFQCTDALLRMLQTRYFYSKNVITWPLAQEILTTHCYTAINYIDELEGLKRSGQKRIQLPWVMPEMPSEEEILKRQRQKQEQGMRLREMMAKRREDQKTQMTSELEELKSIQLLKREDTKLFNETLRSKNFKNEEELQKQIRMLMAKLQVSSGTVKYDLIDIPDAELTKDQLKVKKMQKVQKAAQDARESKKLKDLQEKQRVDQLKQDDPEQYLADLHRQRGEIVSRIEAREKHKQELQNRHSRSSKRRLRTIAQLSADRPGDDQFGENDEDWEVYREIQKDNTRDEEEEDQALLNEVDIEISKVDPNYIMDSSNVMRMPTAEDYQLHLQSDLIRVPELLFQPSIIGIEQAGLADILEQVFKILPREQAQEMADCIFITGGGSQFPRFADRIAREVQMIRPFGSTFNVGMADNVMLDAWKGAAEFAKTPEFLSTCYTYEDYLEGGAHYLSSKHQHKASNVNFPTPHKHTLPYKKVKNQQLKNGMQDRQICLTDCSQARERYGWGGQGVDY